MNMLTNIFQDWSANKANPKVQIFLLFFRLSRLIRKGGPFALIVGFPVLIIYRCFFEWFLGIELPWGTQVGKGFRIHHGVGLVVNDRVVIGEGVLLRHCTTLGVKETGEFGTGAAPRIGNYVDIGCNVVILGGVNIGDYAKIGAGSVVLKDVPAWGIVVGNPGRVIRVVGEGSTS